MVGRNSSTGARSQPPDARPLLPCDMHPEIVSHAKETCRNTTGAARTVVCAVLRSGVARRSAAFSARRTGRLAWRTFRTHIVGPATAPSKPRSDFFAARGACSVRSTKSPRWSTRARKPARTSRPSARRCHRPTSTLFTNYETDTHSSAPPGLGSVMPRNPLFPRFSLVWTCMKTYPLARRRPFNSAREIFCCMRD